MKNIIEQHFGKIAALVIILCLAIIIWAELKRAEMDYPVFKEAKFQTEYDLDLDAELAREEEKHYIIIE